MGGPGFAPPPFGFPGNLFSPIQSLSSTLPPYSQNPSSSSLHTSNRHGLLTPHSHRRHATPPIPHGRSPWPRRTRFHPSTRRPRYALPTLPSQRRKSCRGTRGCADGYAVPAAWRNAAEFPDAGGLPAADESWSCGESGGAGWGTVWAAWWVWWWWWRGTGWG